MKFSGEILVRIEKSDVKNLVKIWGTTFPPANKALIRGGRNTVGKCTGPKWPKIVKTTILVKILIPN